MNNKQTSPDKETRRCKSCGKQLKDGDWRFCDRCGRDPYALLGKITIEPDLQFLKQCSSKELDDLVHVLVYDTDGKERITGNLKKYIEHSPNHEMYVDAIVKEFRSFGGNSFANLARGGYGVPYKEILCDVCGRLGVKYNKNSTTQKIEKDLVMGIFEKAIEKMSHEELKEFCQKIGVENTKKPTPEIATAAVLLALRTGGPQYAVYAGMIAKSIMANIFGRVILGPTTSFAFGKLVSILSGPIGWTITAVWTSIDIAGPAYRVTIPAVFQVIYLRARTENRNTV